MAEIDLVIGRNIGRLRQARGWSGEELGRRLAATNGGVRPWSRQTVFNAEHGHRFFAARDVVALAELFDIEPGYLFTDHTPPTCGTCGQPLPGAETRDG